MVPFHKTCAFHSDFGFWPGFICTVLSFQARGRYLGARGSTSDLSAVMELFFFQPSGLIEQFQQGKLAGRR